MSLLQASLDKKITWIDLPTPAPNGYKPTYTHFEKSYDDSTAHLHRDIIRRNRAKVECTWNYLEGNDLDLLQTLYDQTYFYLRFTDNHGRRVEKQMYAGPIASAFDAIDDDYKPLYSTGVKQNYDEF